MSTGFWFLLGGLGAATDTPPTEAPAAVDDLVATGLPGSAIRLTWSTVAGAAGYRVYRGAAAGVTSGTGTLLGDVATGPFLDTERTPDMEYFYVVVAHNAVGDAPDSNEASATPPLPYGAARGATRPGVGLGIGL